VSGYLDALGHSLPNNLIIVLGCRCMLLQQKLGSFGIPHVSDPTARDVTAEDWFPPLRPPIFTGLDAWEGVLFDIRITSSDIGSD
jgi:hypothetical protein